VRIALQVKARRRSQNQRRLRQGYLSFPFPDEPLTYGDPDPKNRDSDKADKWRNVQDVCGRVSGVAEAATLIWVVTGQEKYLTKAKEFLLKSCTWHFSPDWKGGPIRVRQTFITTTKRIFVSGENCH